MSRIIVTPASPVRFIDFCSHTPCTVIVTAARAHADEQFWALSPTRLLTELLAVVAITQRVRRQEGGHQRLRR
jgi:hypothetical protein